MSMLTTGDTTKPAPKPLLGPGLTAGFAMAVLLWVAWYISHLPWLGLDEHASLPLLLGVWLACAIAIGWAFGRGRGAQVGSVAGFISTLPGLMLLGTKLANAPVVGD